MARKRPAPSNAITDRLEAFIATQERILADFDRSLRNARHFIGLAGVAMEKEPHHTGIMLEQVMEIDLLRHVTEQFDNFQSVAAMLAAAPGPLEADPQALNALSARYEALVQEAEEQAERISIYLTTLRVKH
jgi:hypothetical protein